MVRILAFPARHPYTSKLNSGQIAYVNPDTDYFQSRETSSEAFLEQHHPSASYDLVHIHFSFDRLPLADLSNLVAYFKKKKKKIVWTCHGIESQRLKNFGQGKYQELLFHTADKILTLTSGFKERIEATLGPHPSGIDVIPCGYMASPADVRRFYDPLKKRREEIVYLVGEFRENKEYLQSIVNILQCRELNNVRLIVVFKPLNLYEDSDGAAIDARKLWFWQIIQHPRVTMISAPEISNDDLTEIFCRAHTCVLPYTWGSHSGQLELGRDCGCHVVVANVGYYKEQWDRAIVYGQGVYPPDAKSFTEGVILAQQRAPLTPDFEERADEARRILERHHAVYAQLLAER